VRDWPRVIADGDGLEHLEAPHHVVDVGRRPQYRARRREIGSMLAVSLCMPYR